MSDEMRHIIVAEGDELAVAEALAGPIYEFEPVCCMCGGTEAVRVEEHRETGEVWETPCYLTWNHSGVLAPYRPDAEPPRYEMVKSPDGPGHISAGRIVGVKCVSCDWLSHASAFVRATGPAYRGG